jgi:hypothetical protein
LGSSEIGVTSAVLQKFRRFLRNSRISSERNCWLPECCVDRLIDTVYLGSIKRKAHSLRERRNGVCALKMGYTGYSPHVNENGLQDDEGDKSRGPEFLNSLGSSEIGGISVVIQKVLEEFKDVFTKNC